MTWVKQGNLRGPAGVDGAGGSDGPSSSSDGTFGLESVGGTNFYGFRFHPDTGRLVVEAIASGDGSPVRLPQPGVIAPLDYVQWAFTKRVLNYDWDGDLPARLTMEVSG